MAAGKRALPASLLWPILKVPKGEGKAGMGLIIAAGLTTALALCGFALLLVFAGNRRPLTLALLVALPLQPLAFYLVRLPLDGAVRAILGVTPWLGLIATVYAPLTEEPAKWLTALVPAVRRAISAQPVAVALAVGIGFGIGEIWFLAQAIVTGPNYPDVPFWQFNGFIIERLEVCFLHGAFVSLPFVQLARDRPFWVGGVAGMALHFVLNFAIYLARIDVPPLGRERWGVLLALWVPAFVIACAIMVCRLWHRTTTAAPA